MRYSPIKVLPTVAPSRPSFLLQTRVSSRSPRSLLTLCFHVLTNPSSQSNLKRPTSSLCLCPSSAPRSANISPILSTLRILPVATGMYPSSAPLKTWPPCSPCRRLPRLGLEGKSHILSNLQTLFLSLRSFPRCHRLFSISCGLFPQNTRGGIPLRDLVRCTEAQKCPPVTPLLATLTHSVSRHSFPCHSYQHTRERGSLITSPPRFASAVISITCRQYLSRSQQLPHTSSRDGGRRVCVATLLPWRVFGDFHDPFPFH